MFKKTEEENNGVLKIPKDVVKRLKEKQERRYQRATKHKSNSRRYNKSRTSKISISEMMPTELIREVDEVMERRHDDRLNAMEDD